MIDHLVPLALMSLRRSASSSGSQWIPSFFIGHVRFQFGLSPLPQFGLSPLPPVWSLSTGPSHRYAQPSNPKTSCGNKRGDDTEQYGGGKKRGDDMEQCCEVTLPCCCQGARRRFEGSCQRNCPQGQEGHVYFSDGRFASVEAHNLLHSGRTLG